MNTKIDFLIKLLITKKSKELGFTLKFNLIRRPGLGGKILFDVYFENTQKKSWTINSLIYVAHEKITTLEKTLSIYGEYNYDIRDVYMDGVLLGNSDFYLSNDIKKSLTEVLKETDIFEIFETNQGQVHVSIEPYKYVMSSPRGDWSIGFEVYYKLKTIELNNKILDIDDEDVLSFISGYFNYDLLQEIEDDIAGDIYGVLDNEIIFYHSDDYVSAFLVLNVFGKNRKKISPSDDNITKSDVEEYLDSYFSR